MNATWTTLGIGIYTPAEAAFYAKVSPKIMQRWVFGNPSGKPVIEPQLPTGRTVTFLDLIQTLAVREVRQRYGVSLQRIREGVDRAIKRYGIDYPLARRHEILLFGDPKTPGHQQLVIRLDRDEADSSSEYIQLTGRQRGNRLIGRVVEMFLSDLTFDPASQLASRYRPMVDGDVSVVLDPTRRFGEPLVEPGGYTAEALWHATNVEGSLEDAASACGVSLKEVEIANRYFESLSALRAA